MSPNTDIDTIVALSSGVPPCAVAVLRASGPRVPDLVRAMVGRLPAARQAVLAPLCDPHIGEPVDRGLVLFFPAPGSFTGEDVCEFQVHGSVAVVDRLIAAMTAEPGVRLAERGEFARRAFISGRLDLTQVEGLADLIAAETDEQRRAALDQSGGRLRRAAEIWRTRLIEQRARIEAQLDFSDEADVEEMLSTEFWTSVRELQDEMTRTLEGAHHTLRLRSGFRIALMGPPNAGKSTLLNAFAGSDAAIVTAEPGTTRDVIEVRLDLGGYPVVMSDTAGLREAGGEIEQLGIEKALRAGQEADIILWLASSSKERPPVEELGEVIVIASKADLEWGSVPGAACAVSALTGEGMETLKLLLIARIAEGSGQDSMPAFVTRRRQAEAMKDALDALPCSTDAFRPIELVAEDLRSASAALERLTGRIDVEDILDRLFAEFCIGK